MIFPPARVSLTPTIRYYKVELRSQRWPAYTYSLYFMFISIVLIFNCFHLKIFHCLLRRPQCFIGQKSGNTTEQGRKGRNTYQGA